MNRLDLCIDLRKSCNSMQLRVPTHRYPGRRQPCHETPPTFAREPRVHTRGSAAGRGHNGGPARGRPVFLSTNGAVADGTFAGCRAQFCRAAFNGAPHGRIAHRPNTYFLRGTARGQFVPPAVHSGRPATIALDGGAVWTRVTAGERSQAGELRNRSIF